LYGNSRVDNGCIVVFSDGTGQDGGARPEWRISNTYKMYRISRDHADYAIDPSEDGGILRRRYRHRCGRPHRTAALHSEAARIGETS
jgi:hypothetical protein